jgi:steroid 5-alpha reductase family enzyme
VFFFKAIDNNFSRIKKSFVKILRYVLVLVLQYILLVALSFAFYLAVNAVELFNTPHGSIIY